MNSRSAGQRACDAGWPVVRLFATRLQSPTPAAQSSTDKNPHGIAQLVLQFTLRYMSYGMQSVSHHHEKRSSFKVRKEPTVVEKASRCGPAPHILVPFTSITGPESANLVSQNNVPVLWTHPGMPTSRESAKSPPPIMHFVRLRISYSSFLSVPT